MIGTSSFLAESGRMDDAQVTRFTVLWTKAQPSLLAFISAAVTDFADAEDILQEVATAAVRKFEEYEPSRPFVAWAIGIARFEILRYCRERGTDRVQFVADSLEWIANAFEAIAPELDERRQALVDCLKRLQQRSRLVLEKRYREGLSVRAIAENSAMTPGNISVILHRTHQTLRKCIEHNLPARDRA